jgi:hypothetical protein
MPFVAPRRHAYNGYHNIRQGPKTDVDVVHGVSKRSYPAAPAAAYRQARIIPPPFELSRAASAPICVSRARGQGARLIDSRTGGGASETPGSATDYPPPTCTRHHEQRQAVSRVGRFLADPTLRWDGQRILVIGHVATRWALDHFINGVPLENLVAEEFAWREGWEYVPRVCP